MFIKESEFDQKLKQISDAYEAVKDALNDSVISIQQYPHHEETYDALRILRDYAATGLKAQYKISEE